MKVIRPDAPDLAEKRADTTCTSCHAGSSKKERAARLQEWQSAFTSKMAAFEADLKTVGETLMKNPEALSAELKGRLNDARAALDLASVKAVLGTPGAAAAR